MLRFVPHQLICRFSSRALPGFVFGNFEPGLSTWKFQVADLEQMVHFGIDGLMHEWTLQRRCQMYASKVAAKACHNRQGSCTTLGTYYPASLIIMNLVSISSSQAVVSSFKSGKFQTKSRGGSLPLLQGAP